VLYVLSGENHGMKKNRVEINIYLTKSQHNRAKELRKLGINVSALVRIALSKYHNDDLIQEQSKNLKLTRVQLYLDRESAELLDDIASRVKLTRSDILRRLLTKYLDEHEKIIMQLF
jgi:antitoxin component of RelBE/YafQ-DinJ toxin-antitoxin module